MSAASWPPPLWWIYFGRAGEAARTVERASDPARVARGGFAYAHAIMVAGVLVFAVGVDLTIAEPSAQSAWRAAATILGGAALYLGGNALFKRSIAGSIPPSRILGLLAVGCLVPLSVVVDRLFLVVLVTLVLLVLAGLTTRSHQAD